MLVTIHNKWVLLHIVFFFLIVKFINAVHFTNKGPLHAKAPPIIILVFVTHLMVLILFPVKNEVLWLLLFLVS